MNTMQPTLVPATAGGTDARYNPVRARLRLAGSQAATPDCHNFNIASGEGYALRGDLSGRRVAVNLPTFVLAPNAHVRSARDFTSATPFDPRALA